MSILNMCDAVNKLLNKDVSISGAKTFSSDITNNANENLTSTTYANQNGIIKKGSTPFLHDFNYGNNGTVTTNGYNLFLGSNAGNLTMGSVATSASQASFNIGVGANVLHGLTTGSNNTFNGVNSALNLTTGNDNVGYGYYALSNLTTGAYNVAIGSGAGNYITGGSVANQTSSNSVYIGAYSKAYANGDTNETVIGFNTVGNGSNTVTLGNTNVTDIYAAQGGTATVNAGKFKLSTLNTAPASSTATGTTGEIRIDANYIYVCVAPNTWKRVALATW